MNFAITCTEFWEATVVEMSVFGFGILARLPERPRTQKTWLEHCMLVGLPVRY
jgi:hypothetical protein